MKQVAIINAEKCDGSPMCPARRMCPQNAITQNGRGFFGGGIAAVDAEKCTGCGICMKFCPRGAIRMQLTQAA